MRTVFPITLYGALKEGHWNSKYVHCCANKAFLQWNETFVRFSYHSVSRCFLDIEWNDALLKAISDN